MAIQDHQHAFHHAKTVLRRLGAPAAAKSYVGAVQRSKLSHVIQAAGIFPGAAVSVPRFDAKQGVLTLRVQQMTGMRPIAAQRITASSSQRGAAPLAPAATWSSILLSARDGFRVNGVPVELNSPHRRQIAAVEHLVLTQRPRFGLPQRQFKLANGL